MSAPIETVNVILDSLNRYGISNRFLQAGILGTIGKETNFVPT